MKKKTRELARRTAEEISRTKIPIDQQLILEVLAGSMISLNNEENRILAIKVGDKIYEVWKTGNKNKFDVISQDKKTQMTGEEIITNLVSKVFK